MKFFDNLFFGDEYFGWILFADYIQATKDSDEIATIFSNKKISQ